MTSSASPIRLIAEAHRLARDCQMCKIADFNNVADSPFAGAIIAALYLAEFVRESTPWARLDIMAASTKAKPGRPKGGEATGMRALYRVIRERCATSLT